MNIMIHEPRVATSDDHLPLERRITLDGRIQNALDKAQASIHKVWKCGPRYRVHSASEPTLWHYLHQTLDGQWVCDCYAAQARQVCWHLSRLMIRLEREAARSVPHLWELPPSEEELEFGDWQPSQQDAWERVADKDLAMDRKEANTGLGNPRRTLESYFG